MALPRVLTIAGSDPSGGAGLQADLKTFHAHGVYGMAVVTALTAQNTRGVRAVHAPPASFLDAQLAAIAEDCPPAATKTGMLFSVEIVEVVAEWARRGDLGRLVVDPVMVATSGDRLLRADAEDAVRSLLLPLAEVVTPNVAELAVLTQDVPVDAALEDRAARLLADGVRAVVAKGGHGADPGIVVDSLLRADAEPVCWKRARVPIGKSHGTGCTLSAALAARLAQGAALADAVGDAGAFVHSGLVQAFPVGSGAVPVNHLEARVPGSRP
jgi:hydroxymethylpyrimidine kinase/phosphomethylpyrimidine kinase